MLVFVASKNVYFSQQIDNNLNIVFTFISSFYLIECDGNFVLALFCNYSV